MAFKDVEPEAQKIKPCAKVYKEPVAELARGLILCSTHKPCFLVALCPTVFKIEN